MSKRTFTPTEDQAKSSSPKAPTRNRRSTDVAKTNPRLAKGRMLSYMNFDPLNIPEDVRERFFEDGWSLRWVRFTVGVDGKFDTKNVAKRARMGYIPVLADEVPEFALHNIKRDVELPGSPEEYSYKDVVTQGDLMLCKSPIENVEQYKQEVYEESKLRNDAVSRTASKDGLDINESATTYSGGRIPRNKPRQLNFASDE